MRRRATKQQIATTIGILTVLVAAGYWWSPHIWWAYMLSRNNAKVPRVPVSTLKAPGQTKGWFTCRVGAVSFKLPPEMAEDAERSVAKKANNMISLKTPTVELLVFIPFEAPAGTKSQIVQIADYLNRSPMQLIADGFRASTDDFRWTMSRAELERHQILLNLGSMYPHAPGMKVESLFDGPLEGVLAIHDRTHAVFEWHAKSNTTGGVLGFTATGSDLDLDHLRDICASVTCDDAKLGKAPTKKELEELVDTIELTRDKDL
jgi:hypothetical protein